MSSGCRRPPVGSHRCPSRRGSSKLSEGTTSHRSTIPLPKSRQGRPKRTPPPARTTLRSPKRAAQRRPDRASALVVDGVRRLHHRCAGSRVPLMAPRKPGSHDAVGVDQDDGVASVGPVGEQGDALSQDGRLAGGAAGRCVRARRHRAGGRPRRSRPSSGRRPRGHDRGGRGGPGRGAIEQSAITASSLWAGMTTSRVRGSAAPGRRIGDRSAHGERGRGSPPGQPRQECRSHRGVRVCFMMLRLPRADRRIRSTRGRRPPVG